MPSRGSRRAPARALGLLSRIDPLDLGGARSHLDLYAGALEAVIEAAGPAGDDGRARSRGLLARATLDLGSGHLDCAAAWCERALEVAARSGDRESEALARLALGLLDTSAHAEAGAGWFDQVGSLLPAIADQRVLGLYAMALGAARAILDDPASAVVHLGEAVTRLRAAGDAHHESLALARLANATNDLGRVEDAERLADDALHLAVGSRFVIGEAQARLVRGRVLQARGRFDEAARAFDGALVAVRATGDRLTEGFVLALLGGLALERDAAADALDAFARAAARFDDLSDPPPRRAFSRGLVSRLSAITAVRTATALATLGRFDAARSASRRAAGFARRPTTPAARAVLEVERCRLDLLLARAPGSARASIARSGASARRRLRILERGPVAAASEDVRLALRLLRRDLLPERARAGRTAVEAPVPRMPLVVGPRGAWFRIAHAPAVTLDRCAAGRRIVDRLAVARSELPGQAVPLPELFEAGWPGARVEWTSARNRLHVTLHHLRRLGLRGVLFCRDGGALFDPGIALIREDG